MTTSTHTADSLDTVEAIVSRAILTGQLLPSMRAWAMHLGNKDRAALLSFLDSLSASPDTAPAGTLAALALHATDAADADREAARQFIGAAVLQRVGGAA